MSEHLMDVSEILKLLPHRYPFAFVDRVLECEPGKSVRALKNVTINENFFPGHFPVRPIMPGVLIIETMAQVAGILAYKTVDKPVTENSLFYLVGIDKARFKKTVEPGDQMILDVELVKQRRNIWIFNAKALVDGKVAASAELLCAEQEIKSD